MAAQKNATYKVDNGIDWDEINFKTIAAQVKTANGSNVEEELKLKARKNTANKSPNGWEKDAETGMIRQWGTYSNGLININGSMAVAVVLPISFPNNITAVNAICTNNITTNSATDVAKINVSVRYKNLNEIEIYAEDVKGISQNANFEFKWEAVGY